MNSGFVRTAIRLLAWASLALCSQALAAMTCDVDGSGEINSIDINLIMQALNQHVAPGDLRDADRNGVINVLDARACTLRCTRTHCALPPNAPVASDDSYSMAEDTRLNVDALAGVLVNDTPRGSLTAALVKGPASGTLALNADGSFTYIPVANFNGPVTFTYQARNGATSSNVATVTIVVRPVDDAPIAHDDLYSTLQDKTLNVAAPGVLGNDTDVDGPALHASLVSGPASGTLSLHADGSFSYVPDFNFVGSVTFKYKASDGIKDSAAATVTLKMDAPICPVASTPTIHGSGRVSGSEVWTAAQSPHIVTADTTVTGTLTLEPCAEVLIEPGLTLGILRGQLIAVGTAERRIHIGARTPGQPFAQIRGFQGSMQFAYTTIEGGGDPLNTVPSQEGMINVQGIDQTLPTQGLLSVDHVIVQGSESNGIVLRDGAGFSSDSSALTVTASAIAPVNIWSRAVGTLPTGHYTGNGVDEIVLPGSGGYESVHESTIMHNRDVPYRVGTDLSAGQLRIIALPNQLGFAILTIEPGVTVRFKRDGVLWVDFGTSDRLATGTLVAVGTPAQPIVFTSAAPLPLPGDWLGIYYGQVPNALNRLDFARVEFAGGVSSNGGAACSGPATPPNDAAIRIFGPPPSEFVTNTTIVASALHGIDRGWDGVQNFTDFLSSNGFVSVPGCRETYPRDRGHCPPPTSVPCP